LVAQIKDYETQVRIMKRIPEMRKVEKTFTEKQLVHEKRTQTVSKSKIIMETVKVWETVPVIKEVLTVKKIQIDKYNFYLQQILFISCFRIR